MSCNDSCRRDSHRVFRRLGTSFVICGCLVFCEVYALSTDRDQPISLEANSVEIDEAKGVSVYQGDVVVVQGSIRITADKVSIYQKDKRTEKILAVGKPATFRQMADNGQETTGRAAQAEYYADSDELIMTGDAVLTQGKDRAASDRIIYDRKNALIKAGAAAKGQQRVRITVDPKESEKTPAKTEPKAAPKKP